jgi:spore coat protein U-like protein
MGTQKVQAAALAAAMLLWLCAVPAVAATQGQLGHTSSATIELSLTIQPLIRVSGVQDIELSADQGETMEGSTPVCVGGTYEGEYSIEAQGSDSDFLLQSGEDSLAYEVSYSDASGEVDMQPSVDADGRPLASDIECAEGANALLTVSVDGAQTNAAAPGVYSDTLTLMVSPE